MVLQVVRVCVLFIHGTCFSDIYLIVLSIPHHIHSLVVLLPFDVTSQVNMDASGSHHVRKPALPLLQLAKIYVRHLRILTARMEMILRVGPLFLFHVRIAPRLLWMQ